MSDFPPAKGEPPQVSWEPCEALQADPAYQRSIDGRASKRLIEKIAREWDWRLCAPLTVSFRADEDGAMAYFVIDGQHRLAAAEMRRDIPELPCIISQFESYEAEALAFVNINKDRKSVTALDRFHARVAAKEELALAIKAIVTEAGLTVARNNDASQWKAREIAFPDLIGRELTRDREQCAHALEMLAKAYSGPLLRGVDLFAGFAWLARRSLPRETRDALAAHVGSKMQAAWIGKRQRYLLEMRCDHNRAMGEVMWMDFRPASAPSTVKPITPPANAPRWAKAIADEKPIVSNDDAIRALYPDTDGKTWCDQCEKRVSAKFARVCMDKFCKAKAA